MTVDHARIRVKAMLIAPNPGFTHHAVSVNPPTVENPTGYHRLIGGSVELGETHRDAITNWRSDPWLVVAGNAGH